MKKNPLVVSVWLVTFLMIGLAVGQEDDVQSAHLKPFPEEDRVATNIFTLAPQQTGIYNVTVDSGAPTYSVQVLPPVMDPPADASKLWIWKQTKGGGNAFTFQVVNTIWEETNVTVTVNCTWSPVPGENVGEGEALDPFTGHAKGIAEHQWGDMAVSTNIAVQGSPDYLCINGMATLSSWLVTDEFPHQNYELIESDWSVEGLAPSYGGGTIKPNPDHTVVFTPTNTGLVRVTATESLYSTNSGYVEFTIVEVEIEAEDEPGDMICVGGTKEYTAVITPATAAEAGEFTWSVSNTNNLGLVNAVNGEYTGQTVTVTGLQASASVGAEKLTVEFRVDDELICEPSTNLTVVDFTELRLATTNDTRRREDTTQEDEPPSVTNTLYLVEGTNGMASMTIQGWWEPTAIESNRFLWHIVLTNANETADPPEWDITSSTFTTNPVTVTWNVTNAVGGVTNRQFIVRGWYDCDESGEYDSDFPHRELFVSIIKVEITGAQGYAAKKYQIATLPNREGTNEWSAMIKGIGGADAIIKYERAGTESTAAWAETPENVYFSGGDLNFQIALFDGPSSSPEMTVKDNLLMITGVQQGDKIIVEEVLSGCKDQIAVVKNFSWNDLQRIGHANLNFSSDFVDLPAELRDNVINTILFCLDPRDTSDQEIQRAALEIEMSGTGLCSLNVPSARGVGFFPYDMGHLHLAASVVIPDNVTTAVDDLDVESDAQRDRLGIGSTTYEYDEENRAKFAAHDAAVLDLLKTALTQGSATTDPFVVYHTYEGVNHDPYIEEGAFMLYGDPIRNIKTAYGATPQLFAPPESDDAGSWVTMPNTYEIIQVEFVVNKSGDIVFFRNAGPFWSEHGRSLLISDALEE